MADWIDESQEYQLKILEAQITQATRTRPSLSAFFCVDCDSPIVGATQENHPRCTAMY